MKILTHRWCIPRTIRYLELITRVLADTGSVSDVGVPNTLYPYLAQAPLSFLVDTSDSILSGDGDADLWAREWVSAGEL